MRHTLAVLVENYSGVLTRVSGLFARRGFNIESLAVGSTQDEGVSRMTIVVDCDERALEQICKQLHKLVNVLKVIDLTPEESVGRELALIKVQADASQRPEIIHIVDTFRAKIVDLGPKSLIIEVTGDEQKMEGMLSLLSEYGIMELVRTGKIALDRGTKTARVSIMDQKNEGGLK